MSFSVHELPRAKSDKREIFLWLHERSAQGSLSWLSAYDDLMARLAQTADSCGEALENKDCPDVELKQSFFKTRRGRVYRLLFFIEDKDVYVVRVRGPGQAPVNPNQVLNGSP